MEILIAIVSLICSIFTIVLFFKVWKACDSISTINEKMTSTSAMDLIASGQMEAGLNALKIEYVRKLRRAYLTISPIEDVMNKYKPLFEELGVTNLPDYMTDAKACESYFSKFNKLGF